MLDTIPTDRAQADSATSFYIFSGHVRSSGACACFVQRKRRKKFIKSAILEVLPGKAQPLLRKLINLLAAVVFSGKGLKHGIIPGILLQGQRLTKIKTSEPVFHPSLVFA